jgi:alkanesulfonate monooxygenase SsuD/methylene tetrahydromethanopterin reductase-like flavin-dependent oxidoreductase (luciferase family)
MPSRVEGPDDPVRVGVVLREEDFGRWQGRLAELAEIAVACDIDQLTVGDHISFADGHGVDGLIQASALLAAHPSVHVQTGVYLVGLRHPAIVARQLATIALLAPGRFSFGVGVGGEDPHELELCGVDPRTRGARTTEALDCVRRLMTGEEITFRGRFFQLSAAAIRPAPTPSIPVLVGGRSDAALARAGRLGDGWLALWVSPRRFAEGVRLVAAAAAEAGRQSPRWRHALQLWAGFDDSDEKAVMRVRGTMERSYALPFEHFERYTPCGTPEDVARALEPYLRLGCRRFNFVPEAPTLQEGLRATAAVKRSLQALARSAAPAPSRNP